MKAVLRQFASGTVDVLFPRACVGCGDAVEQGGLRHLCSKCEQQLHLVHAPHCTTCGHPFYGEMVENRLCEHCETLVPEFAEGRTAVLLKGAGRSLIHALKYHEALHVLEDVTALMRRVPGYVDYVRGKVLVPVPLHPRKLRERGYNQSRLLAQCCVEAADGDGMVKELLVRQIDTLSQTHFDRATRQENLKNAFALAPGAVIHPGHHYLLIDDVFTTGSTLNACAAILRKAGALKLDVVTFGHG
ncbi:MAG: amidophosphoribosyltransferase [Opitutus sp.]|nr:amidophosphoribosyltransferase [Opitutus sp.]